MALLNDVAAVLSDGSRRTARQLAVIVGVEVSAVNSTLYSNRPMFHRHDGPRPSWSLHGGRPHATALRRVSEPARALRAAGGPPFDMTALRVWQREAYEAWHCHERRGIVEAVTGSGKTHVALAAIADALRRSEKVAVLVPRVPLQDQWFAVLRGAFPKVRVGRLGGGAVGTLAGCDVLVAVAQSASRRELGLDCSAGLLVADEVHGFGAAQTRFGLEEGFSARLGLSATYRRADGAHETVLEPYFGGVVYELGYRRAIDDGAVARFRVALIPVRLTASERTRYDDLSSQVRSAKVCLIRDFGVAAEPYEAFIAGVNRLRSNGSRAEGVAAGRYWSAVTERRKLLAETPAKLTVLDGLTAAIGDADRAILFTQTIDSAESAAARLRLGGLRADALHSRMAGDRAETLTRFKDGRVQTLVAPTLLDEGIDVPAADLAVILAASQQRRQMIQRMGRVLRLKSDRRSARFAITYVADTIEDPAGGAHEAFLSEVLNVADDVRKFGMSATGDEIRAYLAPFTEPSCRMGHQIEAAGGEIRIEDRDPDSAPAGGSKLERQRWVAEKIGISEAELLDWRRRRAVALVGTKGTAPTARHQEVAAALGIDVGIVALLEQLEADACS